MKSLARKTLFLKKTSILELNTKQLKDINGGSQFATASQYTVSTRICSAAN
ncbi:class I lanthipeptide [Lacinutrix sp.]|uniref:class I lanthipeptide n=1 Tax=Lacinutrix sp. TaxID=1937692 RepID=UPI0025C1340D|nr:class I lanthipeptide [Lacinutrix sp.]